MKKIFTLIAAAAMALSANAQKITFDATDGLKSEYNVDGFKLTYVDTDSKMAVDANSQYFGTATDYENLGARLKTGGKSSSKNSITLTLPTAGTLKIAVRTASGSATDRNLVLTQSGTELFNKVIKENEETDYATVEIGGESKKVFPIVSVAANAGTVEVTYPVNALNFYAFELVAGEGGGSTGGGSTGGGDDQPSTPTAAKTWDFTATSDAAKSAFESNSSWKASTEGTEPNTYTRYTYAVETAKETWVKLDEIGFVDGAGIEVQRTTGKISNKCIRVDVDQRIQLSGTDLEYRISNLVKGDQVSIRYKSASDEERTFTVTNATPSSLVAPKSSEEGSLKEATLTITNNGALVLHQSNAINVLAITINAELPTTAGISALKADVAGNAPAYNLAGQKVGADFKGLVIKNGVKVLNK